MAKILGLSYSVTLVLNFIRGFKEDPKAFEAPQLLLEKKLQTFVMV